MVSLRQFDRAVSLEVVPPTGTGILVNPDFSVVAGIPIRPQLRVKFKVSKSISADPNRAAIKVWNLSKQSRDRAAGVVRRTIDFSSEFAFIDGRLIEGADLGGGTAESVTTAGGLAYVKLSAGYNRAPSVIFEGSSSALDSSRDRVDWITEIAAGDGELGTQKGVANKSFGAGTVLVEVLAYLKKTMGFAIGGTALSLANATLPPGILNTTFFAGFAAVGRARDIFDALILSADAQWFVDDGELWIVARDTGVLPGPPVTLSSLPDPTAARLLGKPRRLESDGVQVRALLNPSIRLGRQVILVSGELAGQYRCESLEHDGDNRAGKFTTTAELRSLVPFSL